MGTFIYEDARKTKTHTHIRAYIRTHTHRRAYIGAHIRAHIRAHKTR